MRVKEILKNYGIVEVEEYMSALNYGSREQYSAASMHDTVEFYALISVMRILTEDDRNIIEVITPDTPIGHLETSVYLFPSPNAQDIIAKSAEMLFQLNKRGVISYNIVARDRYVAITKG